MNILKLLTLAKVPETQLESALDSFDDVKAKWEIVSVFKRRAPFVMWSVCRALPWEAEYLPPEYESYDNNISINGDSATTSRLEDGTEVRDPIPLDPKTFFHSDGTRIQYWTFKRFHARHWWSRYVWLGLRNRASKLASNLGFNVPHEKDAFLVKRTYSGAWCKFFRQEILVLSIPVFGDDPTRSLIWQLRHQIVVGPFRIIRNIGHKINNLNRIDRQASLTWISWSMKIGKAKSIL